MRKIVKYIRVSTLEQNSGRQKSNTDDIHIYEDKISGVVPFAQRPQGNRLIKDIINGLVDEVIVSNINRLGRSNVDIINTIEFFIENSVNLYLEDLKLHSLIDNKRNPIFNIVIAVLSSMAQMQREEIKETQKQGIELAKKNKRYLTRETRGKADTNNQLHKYKDVLRDLKTGKYSINELSKKLYHVYDKRYYNMTANDLKRYKGQTLSRQTLTKLKSFIN